MILILPKLRKIAHEQRSQEIFAADAALKGIKPKWLRGGLNEGFRITFRGSARFSGGLARTAGMVVVTETEIFGRQRQRRPALNARAIAQRAAVDQLLDFSEFGEAFETADFKEGTDAFLNKRKPSFRD